MRNDRPYEIKLEAKSVDDKKSISAKFDIKEKANSYKFDENKFTLTRKDKVSNPALPAKDLILEPYNYDLVIRLDDK